MMVKGLEYRSEVSQATHGELVCRVLVVFCEDPSMYFLATLQQDAVCTHDMIRESSHTRISAAACCRGDPAEWQRDILQGSRRLNNSSSNHHDSRTAASHDHHDSHLSFGSNRSNRSSSQVVSEARNSGSARGGDGSVAPRPYYWRVQQRMLARWELVNLLEILWWMVRVISSQ